MMFFVVCCLLSVVCLIVIAVGVSFFVRYSKDMVISQSIIQTRNKAIEERVIP